MLTGNNKEHTRSSAVVSSYEERCSIGSSSNFMRKVVRNSQLSGLTFMRGDVVELMQLETGFLIISPSKLGMFVIKKALIHEVDGG